MSGRRTVRTGVQEKPAHAHASPCSTSASCAGLQALLHGLCISRRTCILLLIAHLAYMQAAKDAASKASSYASGTAGAAKDAAGSATQARHPVMNSHTALSTLMSSHERLDVENSQPRVDIKTL